MNPYYNQQQSYGGGYPQQPYPQQPYPQQPYGGGYPQQQQYSGGHPGGGPALQQPMYGEDYKPELHQGGGMPAGYGNYQSNPMQHQGGMSQGGMSQGPSMGGLSLDRKYQILLLLAAVAVAYKFAGWKGLLGVGALGSHFLSGSSKKEMDSISRNANFQDAVKNPSLLKKLEKVNNNPKDLDRFLQDPEINGLVESLGRDMY